jgi:hypothetical protein
MVGGAVHLQWQLNELLVRPIQYSILYAILTVAA